ncbi:hypothetical protein [Mycobacterium hubeiense]|uniref:hypothetical protein n=1 Tax=Mycobacterium hubeiense TaxID=1867256 RepID=UPI0011572C5B|nr:hypothetical protein [Mycobacterium sp. QGD 101]
MPDRRLSVNPEGLLAASATLSEHAGRLGETSGASGGSKPSGAGAAALVASVSSFMEAYSARLLHHGQSAQTAADSYITTDGEAAGGISAVSL